MLLFFNHGTDEIKAAKILENNLSKDSVLVLSRSEYKEWLYGFWLGQCINWINYEMDKIGNIGDIKQRFLYDGRLCKPDQPNIWSKKLSNLSATIDFVFAGETDIWGLMT